MEILDTINNIIVKEQGVKLVLEDVLTESKLDSFGYTLLWLGLEDEYNIVLETELISNVNYNTFTVFDLVTIVNSKLYQEVLVRKLNNTPYSKDLIIDNVKFNDASTIKKMIQHSDAITTNRLLPEILEHIGRKNSLALKMVIDNEIVGVWCSCEMEEHISLSFFYVDEKYRKKPECLWFFNTCFNHLLPKCGVINKPILLASDDISDFERYVEHVEDNIYMLKGLR